MNLAASGSCTWKTPSSLLVRPFHPPEHKSRILDGFAQFAILISKLINTQGTTLNELPEGERLQTFLAR
jgi:hypothetical protein